MAQQPKVNAPLEDQANKQTDLLAVNGLQDLALQ